ncbi:SctD/MshK family protein [Sinorhizobium fredii]
MTLEVLKGVHSGVSLPLERGDYLIGSGADCDLMLSDRDVSAHHMRLQFAGSEVLVEAIGADLVVDDTTVPVGHGLQVRIPVTVTLGGARLNLSRPGREAAGRKAEKSSRASWMLGGVAAFSLLTIAAVQAGVAQVDHRPSTVGLDATTMTTGTVAPSAPSPQDVAAALAARLRETGLSDLKIEADGTRVSVSGAVDDKARKSWGEVQAWFDRSYGTNYVLTSLVGEAVPTTTPKFNLQAIWFGETPYAISADGARLYKGAALEDGWYIKDIRDGSLTAARQGEEFVLRF